MLRRNLAFLLLAAALTPLSAFAQGADNFYRGKVIRLIVGYSAGGGFDQYTRLLARHFGHHIPGDPAFVVENMPGAASLKSVQYLDHGAPHDGTAITTFDPGLITQSLTVPERVGIDFASFGWIGNISEDVRVCFAWGATGIKSFADMKARDKTIIGNAGVGTTSYVNARMLIELFGIRLQTVQGYPGSAEKRIAIETGELDGDCGSWTSIPEDWLRDDKIRLVLRFSQRVVPGLADTIPYAGDLLADPGKQAVYRLLMGPSLLGRPFITPRSVPAERVRLLQDAFDATMRDSDFLADADKQKLLVAPMSGPEAAQAVREITSAPAQAIAEAKRISGD
jgi:tripartite-type tricarboxylate transporter receptor subunit TctC